MPWLLLQLLSKNHFRDTILRGAPPATVHHDLFLGHPLPRQPSCSAPHNYITHAAFLSFFLHLLTSPFKSVSFSTPGSPVHSASSFLFLKLIFFYKVCYGSQSRITPSTNHTLHIFKNIFLDEHSIYTLSFGCLWVLGLAVILITIFRKIYYLWLSPSSCVFYCRCYYQQQWLCVLFLIYLYATCSLVLLKNLKWP